jgi:hypothetical protein
MNIKILAVLIVSSMSALNGCSSNTPSSNSNSSPIASGAQTAIREQRATQDFKREGIKIIYSTFGRSIDAIEVTGYAPVWGNSSGAIESAYKVAELDAKRKLNDFINKESIQSSTSVNMITRSLEKAQDSKTNSIANNITTSDEEVGNAGNNVARRQDALTIASTLNQTIRTSSRGILGGLRLIDNAVINEGKNVKVVFRWESKTNNDIIDVRKQMSR